MTKEDIIEYFGIEEPILFFEPEVVFNKGIIGISEDHCHIIYGYWALVTALAEDYEKQWKTKNGGGKKNHLTFITMQWNGLTITQFALCLITAMKIVRL